MNDKQFSTLYGDALTSTDRDVYTSDWALSSLWESDGSVTPERIAQLGALWDAAHLTVKDIRHHTGLSQVAFAQRFCIPRRTVEDWESGKGNCAPYLRLLLAQAVGLYKRP